MEGEEGGRKVGDGGKGREGRRRKDWRKGGRVSNETQR